MLTMLDSGAEQTKAVKISTPIVSFSKEETNIVQ